MERQASTAVIAVTLIGSMIGACDTRPETVTRYRVATSVKGVPSELLLTAFSWATQMPTVLRAFGSTSAPTGGRLFGPVDP